MKYCVARTGIYSFLDRLVTVNVCNFSRCTVHELSRLRALCTLGRCHQRARSNNSVLQYKLLTSHLSYEVRKASLPLAECLG